ncbi:hypothetical protein ABPG77_006801 [Micractinium sp. CCAP 211/92]
MARLLCLVVATALLLASAPLTLAADPEVCSVGYPNVFKVKNGQLPPGAPKFVRAAAPKLAAAVSARAHKHEGCTVDSWTIEAACSKTVKKGQPLSGGFKALYTGLLVDLKTKHKITCPDGGYSVVYEVRGIVPARNPNTVPTKAINTRFIDVVDGTYT